MPFTMALVWSFDAPCSGRVEYTSTVPLAEPLPDEVLLPPLSLLEPQAASSESK